MPFFLDKITKREYIITIMKNSVQAYGKNYFKTPGCPIAVQMICSDVREQHEYDSGHIPGAVLLPVGTIAEDTAAAVIDDLDTVVLVYCRSGNRSKTASQALTDLGYTNVYEFGGINDWPYEIEE